MSEALLAPRERLHTLPDGLPEKTLGYWVAAWMIDNLTQPNGPKAGNAFQPTPGQINFLLHFYEVDENGRFLYRHGVRRLAKGSGKSPFAAALALAELLGPVRLDDFDDDALGGVIGKPVSMPLVHVVATSERQTANTMRMVRAFCNKKTNWQRSTLSTRGRPTSIRRRRGASSRSPPQHTLLRAPRCPPGRRRDRALDSRPGRPRTHGNHEAERVEIARVPCRRDVERVDSGTADGRRIDVRLLVRPGGRAHQG